MIGMPEFTNKSTDNSYSLPQPNLKQRLSLQQRSADIMARFDPVESVIDSLLLSQEIYERRKKPFTLTLQETMERF